MNTIQQIAEGTILTLALSAGANNNVDVSTCTTAILSSAPGAVFSITGFIAMDDATPNHAGLRLVNNSGYACTLKHNSGSSSTSNKILSYTGADVVLADQESAYLAYDNSGLRWRIVAIATIGDLTNIVVASYGGAAGGLVAATAGFANPNGPSTVGAALTVTTELLAARAQVCRNLCCQLDVAPGIGSNVVLEIFKNGTATGVKVTIAGAGTTGNDPTNTISVAAFDALSLKIIPSLGAVTTAATWGWEGTKG